MIKCHEKSRLSLRIYTLDQFPTWKLKLNCYYHETKNGLTILTVLLYFLLVDATLSSLTWRATSVPMTPMNGDFS